LRFTEIYSLKKGPPKQEIKTSKYQIAECEIDSHKVANRSNRTSRQSSINETLLLEQLAEEDSQQLTKTDVKFKRIDFKNGLALLDSFIKTNTLKFTQPKLFADNMATQKSFTEQHIITSKNLKRKSIIRKDSLPRRRQSNEFLMTWRSQKAVSFDQDNNDDEKCKKF
jgi:hypothetical protein